MTLNMFHCFIDCEVIVKRSVIADGIVSEICKDRSSELSSNSIILITDIMRCLDCVNMRRTRDIADRPVALVNEFRRELQVKMIPGPHCTIRKSLMILVSTDLGEFGYIDVHDRLTLNERIQGISNSLELFIKPAELPDRMNNAVLDEHHVAHGTDEVVAAGAIELTPLPEDLISSCRETVQVQLPQDILVDGHLVDMLSILTEFREVILDCFLEIYEIIVSPPYTSLVSHQEFLLEIPVSRKDQTVLHNGLIPEALAACIALGAGPVAHAVVLASERVQIPFGLLADILLRVQHIGIFSKPHAVPHGKRIIAKCLDVREIELIPSGLTEHLKSTLLDDKGAILVFGPVKELAAEDVSSLEDFQLRQGMNVAEFLGRGEEVHVRKEVAVRICPSRGKEVEAEMLLDV